MKVRITRRDPAVALPARETRGAAGFDLAASADLTVAPGEVTLVPTGLIIKVPDGHFLGIFARSSTPLKRGLMIPNGVGVVDTDYSGPGDEIKIQVYNFTAAAVHLKRGDRIAQGIIMPFVAPEWDEGEPTSEDRGGFGSTGF
ncbi:MAG: dUTP diphosphatase [Acidobacteriota bacterium]|nr:dUTP diphosphatase [Acidobacteriota bacterium]